MSDFKTLKGGEENDPNKKDEEKKDVIFERGKHLHNSLPPRFYKPKPKTN